MLRQSRKEDNCHVHLLTYANSVGANDKIRELVAVPWEFKGIIATVVSDHLHLVGAPSDIKSDERQVSFTVGNRGRMTSYYSIDDKVRLLLFLLGTSDKWLRDYARASALPPMIRDCMRLWNRASMFPFFKWLQEHSDTAPSGFETTIQALGQRTLGSVLHRSTLESVCESATLGYPWLVKDLLECNMFVAEHHTWVHQVLRMRAPRGAPTAREAQERMRDAPLLLVHAQRVAGGVDEFERDLCKSMAWDEVCRFTAFTQEHGRHCDVHVLPDGVVGALLGKGDWLCSDYVDGTSGKRRSYYVCPSATDWSQLQLQALSQLPTERCAAASTLIASDMIALASVDPDRVWTWLARHYLLPPGEHKISGDGTAMLKSVAQYLECFGANLEDEFKRNGQAGIVKLARRIALPLSLSLLPVVNVPLLVGSDGLDIAEATSLDSDKLMQLLCELSQGTNRGHVGKLLSSIGLHKKERPAPPETWATPLVSGRDALKDLIGGGRGERSVMVLFFSALESGLRNDSASATATQKAVGAPIVVRRTRMIRPVNLEGPSRIVFRQMADIIAYMSPPRPPPVVFPPARSRKRNRSRSRSRPRQPIKRQRRRYEQDTKAKEKDETEAVPVEETNGTSETHEEAEAGAVEASSRGSPSSVAKSP